MRAFSNSFFGRSLQRLVRLMCCHPGWLIYPQFLLLGLCLLFAVQRLGMDMNRDDLIGSKMKSQQIYLRFEKEFPGDGDELVVVAEGERSGRNRQFIERLAARVLPETNLFKDVFYKGDLESLGRKGLLLGTTNDLAELRRTLHEYKPFLEQLGRATNLDSFFGLLNAQFRAAGSGNGAGAETLGGAVPFLQTIVTQAELALVRPGRPAPPDMAGLFAGGPEAEEQEYVTFDRGRTFLLTARPRSNEVIPQAIERMRRLMRMTQEEVPGLNVGLTGGPVLDYDEMYQAEHDTTVASVVAFVLCGGLFIFAYGQLIRPLKAAMCLIIGIGYTLGFTTLAVGQLNILTITFAPMLIGLAIDFGVHFITRYEEEMRKRRGAAGAVARATTYTGQGIVTGAFTTAAAFLAMALTHFKGIRQMGIISGCGLLLCLIPMMTTLPVLLMRGPQNRRDRDIGPGSQRRLNIEYLWLKHPWLVLSVTALLCVGAALEFHRVFFDYDLLHMQSQSLPSVKYEKKLLHATGASSLYGAVIADSVAQAPEYEAKVKALPTVADARSAADFFTPDQEQKLAMVRAIKAELAGIRFAPMDHHKVRVQSLSATLWYLSGYLGLGSDAARREAPALARQMAQLKESITRLRIIMNRSHPGDVARLTEFQQGFIDSLRGAIEAIQTQDTSGPLRPRDLPPALRDRFIGVTGQYLVEVYPRKNLWEHANQREFIRQLQSVVPPDHVTGTPSQLYQYTTLLKNSYQQAAWYALAAIVLMVFVHFRSFLSVGLALLPVAMGTVWLLGFMGLAHVPFNPANIMTLPLVLGIGVTNGVQILNRYAEEKQPAVLAKSTGKAVLVSGLTAIAGFGSLMLANHQGIRSLGIVMSVGIAACMVAALTVLPALLRLVCHREKALESSV